VISVVWRENIAQIGVTDALDISASPALVSTVARVAKEAKSIILDLTDCGYIDSLSLSAVLKLVESQTLDYIVVPAKGNIRKILTLAGVTSRLPLVVSVEEALENLSQP